MAGLIQMLNGDNEFLDIIEGRQDGSL